jgi:peptidoglycan-associated lipoprotein
MRLSIFSLLGTMALLTACASDMDSQYGIHGANTGAGSGPVVAEAPPSTGMADTSMSDYGTALNTPKQTAPDYVGGDTVGMGQGRFSQEAGAIVYFDYDSSALRPDARATLDKQANWLRRYPNINVTVEGHCDERGTREYNLALGDRRASSIREYLANLGVASSRIRTVSYGKERPAVLGSNEHSWALNRRGVTVVE